MAAVTNQRERYRLSLRAIRRPFIAALAVGGSLAIASSASAIQVPIGSPTDQSPTKSVYALYNQASNGLIQAENLIYGANALSQAPFNFGAPVDTRFTTKFTAPSDLTSSNVAEIATDVAASANTSQMEMSLCVFDIYPTQTHDTNVQNAFTACTATNSPYLAAAAAAYAPATTSGTVQNGVATAATAWPSLSQLVGNLGSATGILNSVDSASVSSSATITSTTSPFAYDIKLSAPSGGYVLPSAFSLTFPAGLSVNAGLVSAEVNAATNTAAVEANPSGESIGTVTLATPIAPLADALGATNGTFTGKVYVVQTGQTSGQGSVTQPYLELWYAPGVYQLGSFPSSLSFPLTLNFGSVTVPGFSTPQPLPMDSLELSFPAATSPVKSSSCTTVPTVGASAIDAVANLAFEFGDTTDGLTSLTGTPTAVTLSASPTVVTNQCVTVVKKKKKKVRNTVAGSMGGLRIGNPTLALRIKTGRRFGTVTIGLPRGLSFVKSKRLAKEISASSGKVKAVRIARGKLVIALRHRVKSTTIKARSGSMAETAGLVNSIKRHRTKRLRLSVRAGSISLRATIKA